MIKVKTRISKVRVPLLRGPVDIFAWEVDSGRSGPHLLVPTAQHGVELQGCEAIRRFVELAPGQMICGKITAIPFLNPPAISNLSQHMKLPPPLDKKGEDFANMNRYWPGTPDGDDVSRLAYGIFQRFAKEVTHVLDLHTWTKGMAPGLIIRNQPVFRSLAVQLGCRFVRVVPPRSMTLGGHISDQGRIGMTYEFNGQFSVDDKVVEKGLKVVVNMARAIGVFRGKPERSKKPILFSDECHELQVLSPVEGLFVKANQDVDQDVIKGVELGHVITPGLKVVRVFAPRAGYLNSFGVLHRGHAHESAVSAYHPYVRKGELLATLVWKK